MHPCPPGSFRDPVAPLHAEVGPAMIASLLVASGLLAASVSGPPTSCMGPEGVAVNDDLRALYEAGRTFEEFYDSAERRRALWEENWAESEGMDPALVQRARAVPGAWRLLVVAVDGCSDSVSTIPWLARLTREVDGLDLRIVDSTAGREVMEAHRTPDGRAATPTVVLMDDEWNEVGCFVERPRALLAWLEENDVAGDEVYPEKMRWYAEDAGRSTVEEIVAMLEAAAAGEVVCGG
jgi:hypothetical protein